MTGSEPAENTAWRLHRRSRELTGDGQRLRLAEKPFAVLVALIEAEGEVVTRGELHQRLWPENTFVDFDNNLNTAVATLRQALRDRAREPGYIETIPRVGYRLIGTIGFAAPARRRPAGTTRGPGFGAGLVAGLIAATIGGWALVSIDWPSARIKTSKNPEAQALFERGRYLRDRSTRDAMAVADLERAHDALQQAAALDPTFAPALAHDADTLVEQGFAGVRPFKAALAEARTVARRALVIDSRSPEALRALAMTELLLDWDLAGAERHLIAASRGLPENPRTALALATLRSVQGRHRDAIRHARRAVALDPESFLVRADLAFFMLAAGRHVEAVAAADDVLIVAPGFAPALRYHLLASERLGHWEAASQSARALMEAGDADPETLASLTAHGPRAAVAEWKRWSLARLEAAVAGRHDEYALQLALAHALTGNRTQSLALLEQAVVRRQALAVMLRAFPEFHWLHSDPRFAALARQIG